MPSSVKGTGRRRALGIISKGDREVQCLGDSKEGQGGAMGMETIVPISEGTCCASGTASLNHSL